jgi:hypothetical protein
MQYPATDPKSVLERIAETFPDESTQEFLKSMARRGIRKRVTKADEIKIESVSPGRD